MKIEDSTKLVCALVITVVVIGGTGFLFFGKPPNPAERLEQQAREYTMLALGLDLQKDGEVDAWFGPSAIAEEAQGQRRSLDDILASVQALGAEVVAVGGDPQTAGRRQALKQKIEHLATVTAIATGRIKLDFVGELQQLYGISPALEARNHPLILDELDALLPGRGSLAFKVASFQNSMVIPADRRQAVFEAALAECRRRTLEHWDLAASESLSLEWTRDVPAAWHEYLGNNHSKLRINALTVALISQSVDLACHEGYPGHHAQFVLMDNAVELPVEDSVVLLKSPGSVLREGAANYGIDLAFPSGERLAFERDVLFPLAGLPADKAATNLRIHQLVTQLSSAAIPVIQEYYDGNIDFNAASFRLEREAMFTSPLAVLEFVNDYGTYSMGYTLVRNLICRYGHPRHGESSWKMLKQLLVQPAEDSLREIQQKSIEGA
ncbi:MAG: hypothetical protein RQ899_09420 [Pseudomonadales bacterium]|nr:hypothetical protein [Pseudomonadales bacterium]